MHKIDALQTKIVAELRQSNCTVISLAQLGGGVPDLLVFSPTTQTYFLLEVKSPKGTLTPAQQKWHLENRHLPRVFVVRSVQEALAVVRS